MLLGVRRGLHCSAVVRGPSRKSIFEKFSRFTAVNKSDPAEGAVEAVVAEQKDDDDDDDDDDYVDMFNPETGEWNGPRLGEPTRYGDWSHKGRCTDFT